MLLLIIRPLLSDVFIFVVDRLRMVLKAHGVDQAHVPRPQNTAHLREGGER